MIYDSLPLFFLLSCENDLFDKWKIEMGKRKLIFFGECRLYSIGIYIYVIDKTELL